MKKSYALAISFVFIAVSIEAQVIDLGPGDTIANNTPIANGTTINVNGGTIGLGVELISGELNVNDGFVAIGALSLIHI